jgi:hypothetical protein
MVSSFRRSFNERFSEARYRELLATLEHECGVPIQFRISETPCFFPETLIDRFAEAAGQLVGQLLGSEHYLRQASAIVPDAFRLPRSEAQPTFVQVDFGIVRTGPREDDIEGRLVELQAFPSLYGFQMLLAEAMQRAWALDATNVFPARRTRADYLSIVGSAMMDGHDPAEVVLMEIAPETQKTRPDFEMTGKLWGVRTVDVRSVRREGRRLLYDRDGRWTPIRRVYNRLIPDDVMRLGLELPFDYRDELEVEWTGGPDWFFKISKFSIPFLTHPWVPRTVLLSELGPGDAAAFFGVGPEALVLKPLFSYAGTGVVFGPTQADLDAIPASQRHLYVCQERVEFAPVIETPHGPTQAELRMMFVRTGDGYRCVLPLVRMGRGKMMGVDHNKGLSWVGASAALTVSN